MLLGGIALGLIAGLVAGGRLRNLADVRLRWMAAIFLAVILRYATEAALARNLPAAENLRLPLLVGSYGLLLVGTWVNRRRPGMAIAFVGILSNAVVIAVNGGYMPIWEPSLVAAGLTPTDVTGTLHILLPPPIDAEFLRHLGPLSDVVPIPIPVVRNVASLGDVVISLGSELLPVRDGPPVSRAGRHRGGRGRSGGIDRAHSGRDRGHGGRPGDVLWPNKRQTRDRSRRWSD